MASEFSYWLIFKYLGIRIFLLANFFKTKNIYIIKYIHWIHYMYMSSVCIGSDWSIARPSPHSSDPSSISSNPFPGGRWTSCWWIWRRWRRTLCGSAGRARRFSYWCGECAHYVSCCRVQKRATFSTRYRCIRVMRMMMNIIIISECL